MNSPVTPNTTERGDRGIPPGEMLWTCHGTMFQRAPGQPDKWDDLPIPEKVRWACVEDQVLKALAFEAERTSTNTTERGQAEGFVLVPREPALQMLAAFWRVKNTGTTEIAAEHQDSSDYAAYRAMLAAAPPAPVQDREGLRKALGEITDAADKLLLSLPGHWHDDATIELTDAAEDARAVLSAAAQNDLYDLSPAPVQEAPSPEGREEGGMPVAQVACEAWRAEQPRHFMNEIAQQKWARVANAVIAAHEAQKEPGQ